MDMFDHDELIATTALNFNDHGRHWLDLFDKALAEADVPIRVDYLQRSSNVEGTLIKLSQDGRPLTSAAVRAVPSNTSTKLRLAIQSTLDDQVADALKQAIESASRGAGPARHHFPWSAVLVQAPHIRHHPTRLTTTIRIGDLTLESEETIFSDVVYPGRTFDGSYRIHQSHPIRVMGKSQASSWESASKMAEQALRQVCGLLALFWDLPYEVATSPVHSLDGDPSVRPARAGIQLDPPPPEHPAHWETHSRLNDADTAWRTLNASVRLQNAIDIYLEARYLEERHQTMALVAYVAAIEAIANILFERPKDKSITKAFKAAIRVVLPEPEAADLDRVYSWRSTTVHQGRLHGNEAQSFGPATDIFGVNAFSNLTSLLPVLGDTAKRLLTMGVLGQLPPKRRLHDEALRPENLT